MQTDCKQSMRIGKIRMDVRGDFLGPPHGTTIRTLIYKSKSRQRSGNDAGRKRFPLQIPRCEKTKLTIRAQNCNPPLKLRKTLVNVTNFDLIFYKNIQVCKIKCHLHNETEKFDFCTFQMHLFGC